MHDKLYNFLAVKITFIFFNNAQIDLNKLIDT